MINILVDILYASNALKSFPILQVIFFGIFVYKAMSRGLHTVKHKIINITIWQFEEQPDYT